MKGENMMKKLIRIWIGMAFVLLVINISPAAADMFTITYYDNYNYNTNGWEAWQETADTKYWNNEYSVNFTSGKTLSTSHYTTGISTFDLRGGFTSLDGHTSALDEDWNPLQSIGDDVSGQSAHHVFATIMTGLVYFNEGDVLSLQSDDDAYIFLDGDTNWGQEILSHSGIHYFGNESTTITAALSGTHLMTVKFAERRNIHSGIQINLNGEPIQPVPIPGAFLIGSIGLAFAGWRLRRSCH